MGDRVECCVEKDTVDGQPGLRVTCSRCQHQVLVRGQTERSERYAFVRLKEECPEGEENYYVSEDD